MLTSVADSIREKNAKFIRNVEYLKETVKDDMIDDMVSKADSHYRRETIDEIEEASEMVKKLPSEEDETEEKTEVKRILESAEDITFEEMVGIE